MRVFYREGSESGDKMHNPTDTSEQVATNTPKQTPASGSLSPLLVY